MSDEWKSPELFAAVSEVQAGDILIADGGFTCKPEFALRAVKVDEDGQLYIDCVTEGEACRHFLEGQISISSDALHDPKRPVYIGLWKYDPANPPPPERPSEQQIAYAADGAQAF